PQAGEAVPQCGNILVANNYFCGSGVCNFMSPVTFSVSFLNEGENLLQIVVTANNNNGNFGLVKVLGLQQEGNNFKVCRTWLATTYSFETPSPGDLPAVGQSYL